MIGEAGRFPELGRTFYERGPGRTHRRARGAFERLAERGAAATSTTRAARHSTSTGWSCRCPINQAMLLGDDGHATPADLDRYADDGVRAFLAAYGSR